MIVRALTDDGDWTFGNGVNNYFKLNSAIAQSIRTRLSTFLGECFFNVTVGVDWWNLLGYKNQSLLVLQCSTVITNTFGVIRLISFSANLSASRTLNIQYDVETIYEGSVRGNLFILTDENGNPLTDENGDVLLG